MSETCFLMKRMFVCMNISVQSNTMGVSEKFGKQLGILYCNIFSSGKNIIEDKHCLMKIINLKNILDTDELDN